MTDRTMLLDTAGLYFRAFHGVPESVTAPDGTPVNAVRGLIDMVAKLVTQFQPEKVVACWDDDWRPAWRVALIPSYKAHRVVPSEQLVGDVDEATSVEDIPSGLAPQIPIIREALRAFGIPLIGVPGYEADDVIGTLAAHSDTPVDIVTGDRDLFQLVNDDRDTRVIYTGRGMNNLELITDAVITTKYGISAAQYVDFAVLRGDPSDGLPGVAGIGEKTAATLLAQHGTLAEICAAAARGDGMSVGLQNKFRTAQHYLDVAPEVVRVATDLGIDIPAEARITAQSGDSDAQSALAEQWGLQTSFARLRAAMETPT